MTRQIQISSFFSFENVVRLIFELTNNFRYVKKNPENMRFKCVTEIGKQKENSYLNHIFVEILMQQSTVRRISREIMEDLFSYIRKDKTHISPLYIRTPRPSGVFDVFKDIVKT